jgi:hypothetical protein
MLTNITSVGQSSFQILYRFLHNFLSRAAAFLATFFAGAFFGAVFFAAFLTGVDFRTSVTAVTAAPIAVSMAPATSDAIAIPTPTVSPALSAIVFSAQTPQSLCSYAVTNCRGICEISAQVNFTHVSPFHAAPRRGLYDRSAALKRKQVRLALDDLLQARIRP